ncbi:MAG: zinc ABC transporter substrate-binding protein [Actinomycetota bacterium]|nr:zinc ABC transporter substrate-binding protein [Actinomycetota bacterium]
MKMIANKKWYLVGVILLVLIVVQLITLPPIPTSTVTVVAAEDTWGSVVSQIGGKYVNVVSVMTDPNADPHEYEASMLTARTFARSSIAIVNGAGYDDWALKLLAANPSATRSEINVSNLLHATNGANPHFWYDPLYVEEVSHAIVSVLDAKFPAHKSYFQSNEGRFLASMKVLEQQIGKLKAIYKGRSFGATEDIFVYFARFAGLNLISPPSFMRAVAESNDPSVASIISMENQIKTRQISTLIFNTQTITPLTDSIKALARSNSIPVVGISEIIEPVGASYQRWISNEVTAIAAAGRVK